MSTVRDIDNNNNNTKDDTFSACQQSWLKNEISYVDSETMTVVASSISTAKNFDECCSTAPCTTATTETTTRIMMAMDKKNKHTFKSESFPNDIDDNDDNATNNFCNHRCDHYDDVDKINKNTTATNTNTTSSNRSSVVHTTTIRNKDLNQCTIETSIDDCHRNSNNYNNNTNNTDDNKISYKQRRKQKFIEKQLIRNNTLQVQQEITNKRIKWFQSNKLWATWITEHDVDCVMNFIEFNKQQKQQQQTHFHQYHHQQQQQNPAANSNEINDDRIHQLCLLLHPYFNLRQDNLNCNYDNNQNNNPILKKYQQYNQKRQRMMNNTDDGHMNSNNTFDIHSSKSIGSSSVQKQIQQKNQSNDNDKYFIAEGTETIRLLIQQQQKQLQQQLSESRQRNSAFTCHDGNPTDSSCSIVDTTTTDRYKFIEPIQIRSIFIKPNFLFEEPVYMLKDIEPLISTTTTSTSSCPRTGIESRTTTTGSFICSSDECDPHHTIPSSTFQQKEQSQLSILSSQVSSPFHVLVGTEDVISKVAGFQVSRGALACGIIPRHYTEEWMYQYLQKLINNRSDQNQQQYIRLIALDGICDSSNLGSIVRTCTAFGIDVLLLSSDCCNPWYRKSVRVSMGHIARIPCVQVQDLSTVLYQLNQPPYSIVSYGAVIDTSSTVLRLDQLKQVSSNWCCVVGNESSGITSQVLQKCSHTIRVEMEPGIDSLSVPVATAIVLHGLRERECVPQLKREEKITN